MPDIINRSNRVSTIAVATLALHILLFCGSFIGYNSLYNHDVTLKAYYRGEKDMKNKIMARETVAGIFLIAKTIAMILILSGCAKKEPATDQMGGEVILGRSLKVISTEPPSPAVLEVGQKLYINIHYRLGPSASAQIWARPYTDGSSTRGYKAHGSRRYKKAVEESGIIQGWFYFDEPTTVDEIRVKMKDNTANETVYTIAYKVDVRWREKWTLFKTRSVDDGDFEGTWLHKIKGREQALILRGFRNDEGKLVFRFAKQFYSYEPVFTGCSINQDQIEIKFKLVSYGSGSNSGHTLKYILQKSSGGLAGQLLQSWKEPEQVALKRLDKRNGVRELSPDCSTRPKETQSLSPNNNGLKTRKEEKLPCGKPEVSKTEAPEETRITIPPEKEVAVVLGKKITGKDINPGGEITERKRNEMDAARFRQWYNNHLESRIGSAIVRPLLEQYVKDYNIEVTDAEIQAFVSKLRETLTKQEMKWEEQRAQLVKDMQSANLTKAEKDKMTSRLETIERILESQKEQEQRRKEDEAKHQKIQEDIAKVSIRAWKVNRALFDKYGGRVIFQQAGPEPLDAYREFLKEQEAKGSFQIMDENLTPLFWNYFTNDKMHTFYSDEDKAAEMMATPWWLHEEDAKN